jgi:DNA-binding CsgD family transcriptional regulator
MLTGVRTTWPLGGRDEEVAHVGALVRRGRGVLLAGPPGVGKTSLAALVGGGLESAGWTVVRVVASRTAASVPFGALAPLLTPGAALGDGTPALVQARAGIASLAVGRPSLVVVDDAQWLDEASAVVLHQLRGDPSALGDAAERFAASGFNLRAAESAMAASEASARAHDQRSAARWARRATELAARCESPATMELEGRAGPVPLTNREREIAQLAADGLPSRVIAERLFVSVRTVDNHLGRIYTKLGVAGRPELRDILRAADR